MDADDWLTQKFNETFKKNQKSYQEDHKEADQGGQEVWRSRGQEEEEEEEVEEREEEEEVEEGLWDFLGKKDGEMSQSSGQKEKSGETSATSDRHHVWFGTPSVATTATDDKEKKTPIGRKKTTAIKKGTSGQRKAKSTTSPSGGKSAGKEKRKSLSTNRTTAAKRKSTSNLKNGNVQGSASAIKKKGKRSKNNGEKLTKALYLFRCEVNVHMV